MTEEAAEVTTLMGRSEDKGRFFPSHLERTGFFISIGLACLAGWWMWTASGWSGGILWPVTICGLPLAALFLTEAIGRVIHVGHVK